MAGYYRMQPEGELLGKLLSKARLTTPEKVGVLGDLGALVRAGKLPYADVLRYVPAFAQDRSRHVVQATLNIVGGLHGQGLVPASQRAAYAAFLRDTYGKQARALGVTEKPGEDEDTRLLRASMIPLLATDGEDKQLAAQARALADRYLVDRKAVSPDMVGPVLRVAAYHGGRAFFEKLRDAASKEKDQVHRRRLFAAMSDSSDPAVLKEALALTLSDKFDPRETVFPIVFGSLEEPAHRGLVYGFVRENFDQLVERLPRDVGGNLAHVGSALCDESKRKEVEAFFGERAARFTGGPRKLAQALERMRLCATFRQSQGPSVEQFLQSTTHKPGMVGPK
jgi:alanyl aminopeptidase